MGFILFNTSSFQDFPGGCRAKVLVVHIVIFVLDEAVVGIREVREGLIHLFAVVEVLGLPTHGKPTMQFMRVQISSSQSVPVKSSIDSIVT